MKKVILILASILITNLTLACELPMKQKLVIGCTYKCDFMYRLRLSLTAMMMGYPIKIVDLRKMGNMEEALAQVDGVLMPGGADINPALYSDKLLPEMKSYVEKNKHLARLNQEGKERDPFESDFMYRYSNDQKYSNLPLLGICRGMQMMSVSQGIPLYLDIKTELGIKNKKHTFERVSVNEDSLMQSIYKRKELKAYKLHHQGVRLPYFNENQGKFPNVKVTSFSNDRKIAESIEFTHRPALGVQYHPEMSFSPTSLPVFKWFLSKSCEYKNSTKGTL